MRTRSLNQDIFRLVVGLVLLTSLTILVNIWWATYEQAQQRMAKDIQIAEQVLIKITDNREELLYTSANLLTEDFSFKQAVTSKDKETIIKVLAKHGERIKADLMAIVSLEGELIAHSSLRENAVGPHIEALPVTRQQINTSIALGGVSSFLIINDRLFKIHMLRIDSPGPIALALVGFEINSAFINELNSITQLNAWIQATPAASITAKNSNKVVITTSSNLSKLKPSDTNNIISLKDFTWHDLAFKPSAIIVQEVSIFNEQDMQVKVLLSQKLETLIGEFSALKTSISFIIIIASIFALFMAALFSRKLAQSLSDLAHVAQAISTGHYQQKIETQHNSKEFKNLANAFDSMQVNISEREKQINYQAQHDQLTDLFTRYHISNILNQYLERNKSFQAIGINIVGFRTINDVFGYQYGDVCLTVLAHRIKQLGGIAARITGGEFLWVVDSELTETQLHNIKRQLELKVVKDGVTIPIKLSLGWINCPLQAENSLELLKRINIALDQAKLVNHRLLPFHMNLEVKYERRLHIVAKLKHAIACDSTDLSLAYQPKLELGHQQVNLVEALMRWTDPDYGFIPPDEFIPIAEQSGLISKVTYWVIARSIQDAKIMCEQGLNISIAVNLSAKDLADTRLLNSIRDQLENANLPPSTLSFEITEGDLVEDANLAIEQLHAYRQQGHKLAIDDFGTGYSSLGYLKNFPVDTLKIDKSFILELSQNKDDQDIVQTIMQLAEKFNLSIVAEGVEDLASLQYLADQGCTWVQGYYVCRPIPLLDLIEWCKQNVNTNWLAKIEN